MGAKEFGNLSSSFAAADPEAFRQAVSKLIFAGQAQANNLMLTKRSLIQWQVPHVGGDQFIEMYINPQNLTFTSRKEINRIRTKGGYVAQYWGEDLDTIAIQGTTGDAGIEGINALRDVYRSEQITLRNIVQNSESDKRRQSLMQLAASVIMWYQGEGYRGFFTDMSYTEAVGKLGLFDYNMNFTVTEILGSKRKNFLPWHRHPWSTTLTPNTGDDQSRRGGGYAEGIKVGVLNTPPIDFQLDFREVVSAQGNTGTVAVAILRPDCKDPSGFGARDGTQASKARFDRVQAQLDAAVPRTNGG